MGQLSSALNKDEVGLLIEAVSDWEAIGNHEYHVLSLVKKHPVPEEEDENYEFIRSLKDHFKKREKEIQDSRTIRQEKAIIVKAKLVLIRQDLGVGQLFENSQAAAAVDEVEQIAQKKTETAATSEEVKRMNLAEFFIKDLGVWAMYQKFLADRGEAPIEDEKGEKKGPAWYHGNEEEI